MESTHFSVKTSTGEAILRQQLQTKVNTPRIIGYKHIQIVYIDFSNLRKPEEIYSVMDAASAFIRKHPFKSLYTLTNITGMHFNNEIFSRFTSYVKDNNPYIKASAVVGLAGLMQIFYNSFTRITGRDVKSFSTDIEAKDFLSGR